MDLQNQNTNLSFSIENILRDDFPQQRGPRTSAVDLPSLQSKFGRWSSARFYRCYAVRYRPVLVRLLPSNIQRVEARLHDETNKRDLILAHQLEKAEEDRLSSSDEKEEEIQEEDEIEDNNVNQDCEPEKGFQEETCQRKRRIRSHFTQRQLQYLEKLFSRQQYLTRDERTLLARGLEMTELQIRNWFQNRRYQKKHRANEDKKLEKPDSSTCEKIEV